MILIMEKFDKWEIRARAWAGLGIWNCGATGGGKSQGTGGNNILRVAQLSTLFSCCVHGKDVAGSRSRAPGQRGLPPKAETLLTFERAMEATNLLALQYLKMQENRYLWKWCLIIHVLAKHYITINFSWGTTGGQEEGTGGQLPTAPSLSDAAHELVRNVSSFGVWTMQFTHCDKKGQLQPPSPKFQPVWYYWFGDQKVTLQ